MKDRTFRRPGPRALRVKLTPKRRRQLETVARRTGVAAFRARLVLIMAQDGCVGRVAERVRVDRKTVRLWRDRYLAEGVAGLKDLSRCGRPVEIDGVTRCIVLSIACGKPADAGLAFRETWTLDTLLEATNACQRARGERPLSRTTVFRVLSQADFRPHRMRYWLHSPDPAFREKVTAICDLYLRLPIGSTVWCVDEKTGMQALGRKHPTRLPEPGREGRLEYEYIRRGTRTLIAAFNPHTGKVFGQVRRKRRAVDLVQFLEALARHQPKGDIHIVWDNLNIHFDGSDERWTRFNERHRHRFHFHYTPIHASWVNQVELFFGILHRRVLRHTVYSSVAALEETVGGFLEHWNRHEAHPFRWTFKGYPLQTGRAAV